ncbi:MAG TPA: glycosyltransferase, partial [Terracidiphilus sp.]
MRIAFIGGFAFSPKGTMRARAHPLAAELVKLGHEVTIFLPPYDNTADLGREWDQEGVRIWNAGAPSRQFRTDGASASKVHGKARRSSYPRLLLQLIAAVSRYKPDLIHVFKPKGFAGAAGSYLLLKAKRVVLDCDDWEGWGGWNDVKAYPWIVKEY